jgi:Galactose oxidase, central domain
MIRARRLVRSSLLSFLAVAAPSFIVSPARAVDPTWVMLHDEQSPARQLHGAAYDPVRNQMVMVGGSGMADWWTMQIGSHQRWHRIAQDDAIGCPLRTILYDPPRDRFITIRDDCGNGHVRLLDIDGPNSITSLPAAPPRKGSSAIYDPVRDRIVFFGGQAANGTYPTDVWVLNLTGTPTWSLLITFATRPQGRAYHNLIYDPVGDRMLVLFGQNGATRFGNVWQLTLSGNPTWSLIDPRGATPSARLSAVAAYDADQHRVLVGFGDDGAAQSDLWELTLDSTPDWNLVSVPAGPAARHGASLIRDGDGRMILFGGADESTVLGDAWALTDLPEPHWTEIPKDSLPGPLYGSLALDSSRDRALMFGGIGGSASLWQLTLANGAWAQLDASGAPPSSVFGTFTYDPIRDRMILFTGSQVMELLLAPSPHWQPVATSGTPPSPRGGHSTLYDPIRDRLVVFGGVAGSFPYLKDTWELSLATHHWSLLNSGPPGMSGRTSAVTLYDPVDDRMILFGGGSLLFQSQTSENDTWAFSFSSSSWTQLAPAGPLPAKRHAAAAYYDPGRRCVVIFGGATALTGGSNQQWQSHNDIWELVLDRPAWTQRTVTPGGWIPDPRKSAAHAYDSIRDQLTIFGGDHGITCDACEDHIIYGDTWTLLGASTTSVDPVAPNTALAIERVGPNPSRSGVELSFNLPVAQTVSIEVLDLAGRRVAAKPAAEFSAGRHQVRVDETARLSPGLYFLKLTGQGATANARICIVK